MTDQTRRQALADFLKAQRKALTPEAAGIPAQGRRRTPGLRREEVAQRANISTTWYTQLEQARDIQVSQEVLKSIAAALHLDVPHTRHLLNLAQDAHELHERGSKPGLPSALTTMLTNMTASPAYVTDAYANLLDWNAATVPIFGDFARYPPEHRNMMLLTFTELMLQERIINWEDFARDLVSHFATNAEIHLGDPIYNQLVATLQARSAAFREWWHSGQVQTEPEIPIHILAADGTSQTFTLMTFQLIGGDSRRLCVFVRDGDGLHSP